MTVLEQLSAGDAVALVSPSFVAPGVFPDVYELGCQRLQDEFGLVPVAFPATAKVGASADERAADLIAAFSDPDIKAVIATIGGNDQVTYIKHLPTEPFTNTPKPFFGFSDNSHFSHFLFQLGIPSYYGGSLFTQLAEFGAIHPYTKAYLHHALFVGGEKEIVPAQEYNDINLDWNDISLADTQPPYEANEGWYWDGAASATGQLWGGCLESIDELLRHNITLPNRERCRELVLMIETSEELPSAETVFRVLRALGERGVLAAVQGVLVGRPKVWEFSNQVDATAKAEHRAAQRTAVLEAVRMYAPSIPVVQNLDFGHTNPQVPMPYGGMVRIDAVKQRIWASF